VSLQCGKLPAIENLLGSEEGLEALAAFLEASGAFTKTGRPRGKYTVPTWEDYIAPRDGGEDEESIEEEDGRGEEDAEDEDEEVAGGAGGEMGYPGRRREDWGLTK
jgi:hypothetical protein